MTAKEFLNWQIRTRKFGASLPIVDRRDRLYLVLTQEYPNVPTQEITDMLFEALPTPANFATLYASIIDRKLVR